jgi:hypothetical protein
VERNRYALDLLRQRFFQILETELTALAQPRLDVAPYHLDVVQLAVKLREVGDRVTGVLHRLLQPLALTVKSG